MTRRTFFLCTAPSSTPSRTPEGKEEKKMGRRVSYRYARRTYSEPTTTETLFIFVFLLVLPPSLCSCVVCLQGLLNTPEEVRPFVCSVSAASALSIGLVSLCPV